MKDSFRKCVSFLLTSSGRMESQQTFGLQGTFVLNFDLAGSHRGDTNTVTVSLADAFSEEFTLESNVGFTPISRTIVITKPTCGRLVFDHQGTNNLGLLLDNVSLECVADYVDLSLVFPVGDINKSCFVNLFDFAILASYYLDIDCNLSNDCDGTDLNQSGNVDLSDGLFLFQNWLTGVGP